MTSSSVPAPSGMVTFVFTDIEGSTRLFHRFGDDYPPLLKRHNDLLSATWSDHHGYEVSREGDSYFVAFASADDAVRACAAAQRALQSEPWPDEGEVRVRMGVHTGLASLYGGGYIALAVHQAARVMAAAHGGQVILSQDAVEATGVFEELELRPVGRYQLRSFDEPLDLYQLAGPGLADDFPALRAVPAGHHNIVRPPTPTLGRSSFIEAVAEQVRAGQVVTLVGPGGIGKTTVAAEVGVRLAASWEDGVWLVDLAAVEDAAQVAPAIASAVGASRSTTRDRWDDVVEHLASKQAVIILDNCEQVLDACTQLAASLEGECPGVAILATSRIPLHVPGEVLWHVAPLEVPGSGADTAEEVLATAAGKLFAERGAAARPGFAISDENAAEIAQVVRRLDGLPLALELAAARLAMQSPAEINAGLAGGGFAVLSGPGMTRRHASMEELLAWSYRSLDVDEQAAFRRLSVFAGGFTLETAPAAVAGDDIAGEDVSRLLFSLVDRSLVVPDLSANATRYRLLETHRAYGRRLLDDSGETGPAALRAAGAQLERTGPWDVPDGEWLAAVDVEIDNLRTLIGLIPNHDVEIAQQVACTIGRYHDASQSFKEGITELGRYEQTLSAATPARVSMLATLADLRLRTGEVEAARRVVDDARALRRKVGAPDWDDVGVDRARGEVARRSGDLAGALAIAREALEHAVTDRGRSRMFNLVGSVSAAIGDMEAAFDACESDLDLSRSLGHESSVAAAHGNLAEIAMRMGDVPEAARHQKAALDWGIAQGSMVMVAFSLIMAARIAGSYEDWAAATLIHAQADALLERIGLQLFDDDRAESDRLLATAREALGEAESERLGSEGANLDVPEAVERASNLLLHAAGRSSA